MQHKKTKHTIAEGQRASRCFQWHLLFPELLIGQLLNSEGNSGKDWTCVFPRVVDRAIVDVQGHLGEKSSFCFFLSFWQGSCFFPREARGKNKLLVFTRFFSWASYCIPRETRGDIKPTFFHEFVVDGAVSWFQREFIDKLKLLFSPEIFWVQLLASKESTG